MRYLVLAAFAFVLLGLAPLASGADERGLAQVELAIKEQMNSGPHGRVTRDVRCVDSGATEARCTLTSIDGTELHARVVGDGDEHRLIWEPLEG
jgi:hypothetical protein